jgi:hypothetical protein
MEVLTADTGSTAVTALLARRSGDARYGVKGAVVAKIWRLLERQNSQQKNPASLAGAARGKVTVVIDKHSGFG